MLFTVFRHQNRTFKIFMNSVNKHVHFVLLCFWRWELVMFFYVLNDFFLARMASLVKHLLGSIG